MLWANLFAIHFFMENPRKISDFLDSLTLQKVVTENLWITFRLCVWEINKFQTFVNVTIWIEWCFDTVEISFRKCCSSWTCDIYQFTIITHCISIAIPFDWFRSNGLSSVILDRISGLNPCERFLGPSPSDLETKSEHLMQLWPFLTHWSTCIIATQDLHTKWHFFTATKSFIPH